MKRLKGEAYVASAVVLLRRAGMKDNSDQLLNASASEQARVAGYCMRDCAREVMKCFAARRKALLKAMTELDNVIESAKSLRKR